MSEKMELDLRSIKKELQKELGERRFSHTIGVMHTAMLLASCHDVSVEKAKLAALMHDCAKKMKDKDSVKLCEKYHVEISETERRNPYLLHAKTGAVVAKYRFHIEDEEILEAIRCHTTGKPGMSKLAKVIYISDYIEPCRTHFEQITHIRKLAFQNLDDALIEVLKDTLCFLEQKGTEIDSMTKETYEYYRKERN